MRRGGLFVGLIGCVAAVGLAGPALADEAAEGETDSSEVVLQTQVAQGFTGYEIPRRGRVEVERGETVRERARPEYDALGGRLGAFFVFPSLTLEERYESNIFATPNNEEDDFITRILPNVAVRSNWSRHRLDFNAGAAIGLYADNNDENYEDYHARLSGRVDVNPRTFLSLATEYQRRHEERSSPDDAGGVEPTELDVYTAEGTLSHDFGRVNASVGGSVGRTHFEDVQAGGGGTILNHNRDRDTAEGFARVGVELQRAYEAFIRGSYNIRNYHSANDNSGVDRDSTGYTAQAGLSVDFGGLLFGEFAAGYRYQNYDDPTLDSFSGVGASADFTWNPTGLTTVTANLQNDVRETTSAGASGSMVSSLELGVDHELMRNVILGANGSLTRDDFEGINRTDYIYGAGADVTYLLNRYFSFGLDYGYQRRDADTAADYVNHVVLLRVRAQY